MNNEQTDVLDLVHVDTLNTGIFGEKIGAAHGFSKEIFRQGLHTGSVRAPEDTNLLAPDHNPSTRELKVNGQVTLVNVNLGLRTLDLKGSFHTQDGFTPSYDVQLELRINNPLWFAQHYLRRSDPIALVKSAIIQEFNEYALRTIHENLSQTKLRYDALSHIQSKHIGVLVTQIFRSNIYSDAEFTRLREIRLGANRQKLEIETKAEVESYQYGFDSKMNKRRKQDEQELQAMDNAFEREEALVDQNHENVKEFREKLADRVLNHLLAQIDNQIDQGLSLDDILENPMLQKHIAPLIGSQERPALPEAGRGHGGTVVKQERPELPPSEKARSRKTGLSPIQEANTGQEAADTGQFRVLDEDA